MKPILSLQQAVELHVSYMAGTSTAVLARDAGIRASLLIATFHRFGLEVTHTPKLRGRTFTRQPKEQASAMCSLYQSGMGLKEVASKYNITVSAVGYQLKRAGIATRPTQKHFYTDTERRCSVCKLTKPILEFPASKGACTCKACMVSYKLLKVYGVTLEQREAMRAAQGFKCACCGIHESLLTGYRKKLVLDHNHKTSQIRGLLCESCNLLEGRIAGDLSLIQKALDYIKYQPLNIPIVIPAEITETGPARGRQRNYGLTSAQFDALVAAQSGVCSCCGLPVKPTKKFSTLVVDHCHTTNCVRGLVHQNCNLIIGLVERIPDILPKMSKYLGRTK